MRHGVLGTLAALAASAGLAFGQAPPGAPAVDPTPAGIAAPLGGGQAPMGLHLLPRADMGDPMMHSGAFGPMGGPPENCFFLERTWTKFEYLLWTTRDGPSTWPIAVIGTVANGVDPFTPGSISLLGGRELNWDAQNGARFTIGAFLPGSTRIGVEATGTILEVKPLTRTYASGPQGLPVLGTPFVNELTGVVDSVLASAPGNPGSIFASAKNQMWSAEFNMLANVLRTQYVTINLVGGFRHFSLAEGLYVQHNTQVQTGGFTFLGAPIAAGTQTALEDRFDTQNRFYGGQIGYQFQYRWRCLTFDAGAEFAMGVMRRTVDNSGFSQAGLLRVPGGVLVSTTNIGTRSDNDFGVVPQLKWAIGWQVSQSVQLTMGLDFLYASSVVRPGNQVDPVVNPSLVPFRPEFGTAVGTARPTQLFTQSDWWVTGFSWGLNIRY